MRPTPRGKQLGWPTRPVNKIDKTVLTGTRHRYINQPRQFPGALRRKNVKLFID